MGSIPHDLRSVGARGQLSTGGSNKRTRRDRTSARDVPLTAEEWTGRDRMRERAHSPSKCYRAHTIAVCQDLADRVCGAQNRRSKRLARAGPAGMVVYSRTTADAYIPVHATRQRCTALTSSTLEIARSEHTSQASGSRCGRPAT